MKIFGALFLALVVLLNGMPLSVFAQESPTVFAVPDGIVGEPYRANLATVLRENYQLRLETNSRASLFRWSVGQGDVPPGLIVRANGTIVGSPRVARAEPYRFQLKVVDLSSRQGAALTLDFSIAIAAPRIRLAHVNVPRLVPTVGADDGKRNLDASSAQLGAGVPERVGEVSKEDGVLSAASRPARLSSNVINAPGWVYASMLKSNAETNLPATPKPDDGSCDPNSAPRPSATPGPNSKNVILIDARSGSATYETLHFKKGDRVRVIVDNKNPYLYTYKYTSTATEVNETALGTFLPLLGGIVGEILSAGDSPKQSTAPVAAAAGCEDGAAAALQQLERDMDNAAAGANAITDDVKGLKRQGSALAKAYEAGQKQLRDGNKSRGELYCASKDFLQNTKDIVDEDKLEATSKSNETLEGLANGFLPRIEFIRATYPKECLDAQFLYRSVVFANGLIAVADKNKKVLEKISSDLEAVGNTRESVATILRNPNSFFEEHVEGSFDSTRDVEVKLELTPIEKSTAAAGPYKVNFRMGSAPFFSLSAGVVFSPLRKFEFDRIQGFERDEQGNTVLVNGQPNLTTVIGLKETSRTRISPILFLNGRVHEWDSGPIDGLHISLGLTAKNDNEGLDPEFLVGPSLSMLERKLFFTFGGYAGRQQKLTGGLFEGFAVPSTVTDLPIQKNYRWSFGFALSYQLPIKSNGK